MSEAKPVQNKPLLFVVIVLAIVIAVSIARLKTGITHDAARAMALDLLPTVCASDCASRGLTLADLKGPAEGEINRAPSTTKFEFIWTAANGRSLHLRVWDNGLTVQKGKRWDDTKDWQRL